MLSTLVSAIQTVAPTPVCTFKPDISQDFFAISYLVQISSLDLRAGPDPAVKVDSPIV